MYDPPTPADARGSAPGNNTFDSCFGLLPQPAQQQQQLLLLLWVSEVTLGIFGVQFWGFSVLQRHGVSLPAGIFSMVFSIRVPAAAAKICAAAGGKGSQNA